MLPITHDVNKTQQSPQFYADIHCYYFHYYSQYYFSSSKLMTFVSDTQHTTVSCIVLTILDTQSVEYLICFVITLLLLSIHVICIYSDDQCHNLYWLVNTSVLTGNIDHNFVNKFILIKFLNKYIVFSRRFTLLRSSNIFANITRIYNCGVSMRIYRLCSVHVFRT